jgi:hypothetical protein
MCSQWSSKQRIRLNLPISAFYPHFSVLYPFQRFIPISAFYPHFSVLSPFQRFIRFQRFIPISVTAFSFRFRDSVSAFYPYPWTCNQSRSFMTLINQSDFPSTRWTGIPQFRQVLCQALLKIRAWTSGYLGKDSRGSNYKTNYFPREQTLSV